MIVGRLHVRADLAFHALQLVQVLDRDAGVGDRHPPSLLETWPGSRKRSAGVPSLMMRLVGVVRQRPTLAFVRE